MYPKTNFIRPFIPIFIFKLILAFGCNSQSTIITPGLTNEERHLCDSLKLDSSIVVDIRTQTDSVINAFPANLENILERDIDIDTSIKPSVGLIFNSSNGNSDNNVTSLYNDFKKKGYTIFFLERNFGIGNESDVIGVLKTTDKYHILKQIQTDGINWEIDNDSLVNLIRKFDNKYSLDLIGASGDWCEFIINKEPLDWLILAKEVYKVCPDVVDQGAGSVEKLATEMKQTKRLYFWWD